MGAAFRGQRRVCRILLDAGANASHKDTTELNADPMLCAAQERHLDIVSLLLQYGASPLSCTAYGANGIWLTLSKAGDAGPTVAELVKYGVPPQCISNQAGFSTLHQAARFGHMNAVLELLKFDLDVSSVDKKGRSALHYAAAYSVDFVISDLVNAGADVHARDNMRRTCLHLAARTMNHVAIRCLVGLDADVNAKDSLGWTPLIHACSWDQESLRNYTGGYDTQSTVGELLESGSRVNARTRRGLTALHFVSVCGRPDLASTLLLAGANVDARTRAGRTPLHLAAISDRSDVVRILFANGADVDAVDGKGNSALHSASMRGHCGMVALLLSLKANILTRNTAGRTALDLASRAGHSGTVEELLDADVCYATKSERSAMLEVALAAAKRHERRDVAQLLTSCGAGSKDDTSICSLGNGKKSSRNADEDIDEIVGGQDMIVHLLTNSVGERSIIQSASKVRESKPPMTMP